MAGSEALSTRARLPGHMEIPQLSLATLLCSGDRESARS